LILSLSDSRWDAVQQESLRLLEQVMRSPVRTDNLDAVQASIPSLVNLTLSDMNRTWSANLSARLW